MCQFFKYVFNTTIGVNFISSATSLIKIFFILWLFCIIEFSIKHFYLNLYKFLSLIDAIFHITIFIYNTHKNLGAYTWRPFFTFFWKSKFVKIIFINPDINLALRTNKNNICKWKINEVINHKWFSVQTLIQIFEF